jgi:vacuolar protein sorting-associated protein IST1
MHKTKGKLSGVLHKGFKPDKWSVRQIGFRFAAPPRARRWVAEGVGDSNVCFGFFFSVVWFPSKTSLRMAVARIKLLRNRKEVQVRQMRREVAQLLEANQDMTARIRVRAWLMPRLAPSPASLAAPLHHPIIICHFTPSHWS